MGSIKTKVSDLQLRKKLIRKNGYNTLSSGSGEEEETSETQLHYCC